MPSRYVWHGDCNKKQIQATRLLEAEMGHKLAVSDWFLCVVDFETELRFPAPGAGPGLSDRLRHAVRAAREGPESNGGSVSPAPPSSSSSSAEALSAC